MTIIHLIRHGDVHNPQKIFYGRLPRFRLSHLGQEQAAAAGEYLKDRPLAAVISSPQLRARQTAAAVATPHDLPVRHSRLIAEILTPHQGRPIAELEAEDWILYENLPPGYESPEDILDRVLRLINRVRRQYPGQEVALVTHGDVVLNVRFWVEGVTFSDTTKSLVDLYPATASITTLTFVDGQDRPQINYVRPY